MSLKPPQPPTTAAGTSTFTERLDTVEAGVYIVPEPTGVLATDSAAILATITAAAAAKGVCEIRDWGARYVCSVTVASLSHVKIRGDATLHNPTASAHALSLTDCPDAEVEGLWVQGASGTFDGIHLERCPRSKVKVRCRGTGRNGVYAEECVGIDVDSYVGVDVTSPYPTGVTESTGGVKLTWDLVNTDSGCNQFTLKGWYVIGKDRGWAVEIVRAEGGVIGSTVPELSKGGIKLDTCQNLTLLGYYGEANPSDVEYTTGTCDVTSASAAVVGTATAWNTNDAEGNKNAMVGKFLIVGTAWAPIGTITDDTHVTLASNWPGSTLSAQAYRMQCVDLYLKSCTNCTVLSGGRGGGAVLLEASSGNLLDLLTESIFFDSTSNYNIGRVITNRASTSSTRKVDNGTGNQIDQLTWRSGGVANTIGLVSAATARNNQANVFTALQSINGLASGSAVLAATAASHGAVSMALRNTSLEFGDGTAARDVILVRGAAAVLSLQGASSGTAALELVNGTAPASPAADRARLYVDEGGAAGANRLMVKWSDGTTAVLATGPVD